MNAKTILTVLLCLSVFTNSKTVSASEVVATSDRTLPVAYDVDVLVLGGSTGAVAAACTASQAGAETMLLTPFPYLGENLTATLKLWHNDKITDGGDLPFYDALMNDPIYGAVEESEIDLLLRHPKKLPFTYEIIQEVHSNHSDTPENDRLRDGKAASPRNDSVQVNGDATIVLDLGSRRDIGVVSLISFYRQGHFLLEKVDYFISDDKTEWKPFGTAKRNVKRLPISDSPETFTFSNWRSQIGRYIKIEAKLDKKARIALLGEIVVLANGMDLQAPVGFKRGEGFHTTEAPRPLHVKQTLDEALLQAKVRFLYGTYVTGLLRDPKGEIRGAVITSRAGRQAITARSVIDARPDYRQLLDSYENDATVKIEFVVIGGRPVPFEKGTFKFLQSGECETMDKPYHAHWPNPARTEGGEFPFFRYTFDISKDVADKAFGGDVKTFGELETEIRLATYHKDQQFTADRISLLPGSKPIPTPKLGNRSGRDSVIHGLALGKNTAKTALETEKPSPASLRVEAVGVESKAGTPVAATDIRELLQGIRPYEKSIGVVQEHGLNIPVVGAYDVVVVGGGTTGAPAGIAAARAGAKTLVVEYQHEMGGVGTVGAIAGYYWGNKVGFTKEVSGDKRGWNVVHKAQTWRTMLRDAGGDAWYGALGAGAVIDVKPDSEGRTIVKGVLIATEFGPKIVLANVVVDTTGNGDIAMTAGAEMRFVTEGEITVQGSGLPPRFLGGRYMNNDFTYIDDTDPIDATHVFVYGKAKFPAAFDQGKLLNTRERRRIVGEFSFTALDQINLRTYPDSIARSFSNLDSHGYTIEPYLEIVHPDKVGIFAYYPYRSSIPKGLDGILVGALATSCHRDALPLIRMQSDLQNQGYGLGYAAATIVRDGATVRDVDIRKVQRHLVDIGNLPEEVLTETDNFEASKAGLAEAVQKIPNEFEGLSLVMWHPEESLPMLQKAYTEASEFDAKFAYAKVLAAWGDGTGEDVLLEAFKKFDAWDIGWNFKAMSQFGMASSSLDQVIMMLGRIRSRAAVPLIVERLFELKHENDFSHHRACALALERIGDPAAAPALAEYLRKPGMTGYVHDTVATAKLRDSEDPKVALGEKSRRDSLIEIGAARALYRLGDVDGVGRKILESYKKDLRGLFARHAAEALDAPIVHQPSTAVPDAR